MRTSCSCSDCYPQITKINDIGFFFNKFNSVNKKIMKTLLRIIIAGCMLMLPCITANAQVSSAAKAARVITKGISSSKSVTTSIPKTQVKTIPHVTPNPNTIRRRTAVSPGIMTGVLQSNNNNRNKQYTNQDKRLYYPSSTKPSVKSKNKYSRRYSKNRLVRKRALRSGRHNVRTNRR